jgi:hypothetical protein
MGFLPYKLPPALAGGFSEHRTTALAELLAIRNWAKAQLFTVGPPPPKGGGTVKSHKLSREILTIRLNFPYNNFSDD